MRGATVTLLVDTREFALMPEVKLHAETRRAGVRQLASLRSSRAVTPLALRCPTFTRRMKPFAGAR